jgi:hypothetical protein
VGVVAQRAGAGWWAPAVVAWFGLSAPVQLVATAAWSEPLALALCAWAFVGIQQYVAHRHARWLVLLVGLAAGAAVLVRTSSAFWVLGLVAACWINSRFRAGLLVGLVGAAPAGLCALINYLTHGDAAGMRGAPSLGAASITRYAIRTAAGWWSLARPGPWHVIGLVVLAALVIVVARSRLVAAARAAIVLLAVVATGTLGISILVAMDGLSDRLMAPVLVGMALVVATTISSWRTTRLDRALAGVVAIGAALGAVHGLMVSGPREVLPPDMRCAFPHADLLMSNAPEAVAYRCARPVAGSPRKYLYATRQSTDELAKLAAVQASRCVRLVWIDGSSSFRHSRRDLESIGFTTLQERSWRLLSSQGCRSGHPGRR